MRRIDIDFRSYDRGRRSRWIISAILVLLVLSTSLFLYERKLDIDVRENRISEWGNLLPGNQGTNGDTKDTLPSSGAISELGVPWDTLINSLDIAHRTDVRLDRMQTDAANRALVIEGSAAGFSALNDYIVALAKAGLVEPTLVSESRENSSSTIRFKIQAKWPLVDLSIENNS